MNDASPSVDGKPQHVNATWLRPWRVVAVTAVTCALLICAVLAAEGHSAAARWILVGLSTALAASSSIPSIRAVLADPASLQPVTWGLWAALTALAALASALSGDWPSAIFSLVGTATCATITIVVLRVGQHTFGALDATCAALAIVGLVAWQTLHQPDLAIFAACAGDLAALTPTIVHAWQRPHEEPTASFALIAAGGLCTAAAAWGHWTVTALAYPLYVALSTGTVAAFTLRQRPMGLNLPATPAADISGGAA